MKNELFKQNEEVVKRLRVLKIKELKKNQIKADLFLNTNFEEELGVKRATEKQKDSYINLNEDYAKICQEAIDAKLKYEFEKMKLTIMMLE